MQQPYPAIGILGGTFDPIHYGHLRLALELRYAFNLNKIHIIPCYQPVHRQMPVASPRQRLAMVEHAIATEPSLLADDREIRRHSPSYCIDTLLELSTAFPNTVLCLLMGIDTFLSLTSWYCWQDIFALAHVLVAHRPSYQLPHSGLIADLLKQRLTTFAAQTTYTQLAGSILLHPITSLDISATEIRKQIAAGQNPRYLLPDSVYQYISQHGIYCQA